MKKTDRLLLLFYRLMQGEHIKKNLFIEEYSVSKRTFDRYVEILRLALSESYSASRIQYEPSENSYYLTGLEKFKLRGIVVLPIIHLLFGTRSLSKDDIASIIHPLLSLLPSTERIYLREQVIRLGREYDEPEDTSTLLKLLWDLEYVIKHNKSISIKFKDKEAAPQSIDPIKVMHKNGSFHLLGTLPNDTVESVPLEKISSFTVLSEKIK